MDGGLFRVGGESGFFQLLLLVLFATVARDRKFSSLQLVLELSEIVGGVDRRKNKSFPM